jgi:hypothetical protein
MSSKRKTAANRANGQKSHGPKDTTSTRFNATKHGLLANGISELDNAEGYQALLVELSSELQPVGPIETFMVESAALDIVRSRRARHLEAEYITSVLHPPTFGAPLDDFKNLLEPVLQDPGLPAAIGPESAQKLLGFQRYESTFRSWFFKTLHELERLQRTRQGERVPAPAVLDVNIHAGTAGADPHASRSSTIDAPPCSFVEEQTSAENGDPLTPGAAN